MMVKTISTNFLKIISTNTLILAKLQFVFAFTPKVFVSIIARTKIRIHRVKILLYLLRNNIQSSSKSTDPGQLGKHPYMR